MGVVAQERRRWRVLMLAMGVVVVAAALLAGPVGAEEVGPSPVRAYAVRIRPGQDVRKELEAFAKAHHLRAGFIMAAVGSLRVACLRCAGQAAGTRLEGAFEIVSLSGTLAENGCHLHAALSDEKGRTVGGHVVEGCLVRTTVEIVIGELTELRFRREVDPETTYPELRIERR